MIKFGQCITIYNRYKDGGKERYHRTVLCGVFWDEIKGHTQRMSGAASTDKVQLIIPASNPASKDYVAPERYCGIGWTLKLADIAVLGIHNLEIAEGQTIKVLDGLRKAVITAVDFKEFNSNLSHWEVTAR